MDLKENLTNEKICSKFTNQFELVNYAIVLVTEMIHSGRAGRTSIHTENPALQVLEEIVEGKDKFDESSAEEKAPVINFEDIAPKGSSKEEEVTSTEQPEKV